MEISWPIVGPSIPNGANEVAVEDLMTPEQYYSSAATFNPTEWDATGIARLAKRAGAGYVVFTAKHHGGYAMWHTAFTDFSIERSEFGRDVVLELVDALRAEGIRVGLYFSLADWHHPDYPAFELSDRPYPTEHHPVAEDPATLNGPPRGRPFRRSSPAAWERYLRDLRGELSELLTRYGTIDLLFFDGEWERSAEEWDTESIHELIRSLQPDVVINDRLTGFGDYGTPEQAMPMSAPDGPWELNLTIGRFWSYRPEDTRIKSTRALMRTLSEVTSRGGNMLLNIAPLGDGGLQRPQVERLEAIGGWLERHGPAVIGVEPAEDVDFYGPVTRGGDTIYLHLHSRPIEEIVVRNLPVARVTTVRLLATGEELPFEVFFDVHTPDADRTDPLGEIRIVAPETPRSDLDIIAVELTPRG